MKPKVFLICPVRGVTEEERKRIEYYVDVLEINRHAVYWPERDTGQTDTRGIDICRANRAAIRDADEVHVWWNGKSQGSVFDFGIAFALGKTIVLANPKEVKPTPYKSFKNVLRYAHFFGEG